MSDSKSMQMPESGKAVRRDRTDRTKDRSSNNTNERVSTTDAPKKRRRDERKEEGGRRVERKVAESRDRVAESRDRQSSDNQVKPARTSEKRSSESSSSTLRSKSKKVKVEEEQRIPDVSEVLSQQSAESTTGQVPVTDAPGDPTIEMLLRTGRKGPLLREELTVAFDTFVTRLESELSDSRENKRRVVNVRVWRSLLKDIKKLKAASLKSMKKTKKITSYTGITNISGFMKPVRISEHMAMFTGWDPEVLRTRVEVTNFVCSYIKSNNLQNPDDKRQIFSDEKLRDLLNYDPNTDDKPLTYCYIQKKIQHHFSPAV